MEETPKSENAEGNSFDVLRSRLLSGKLDPEEFINTIFELDQSDPNRTSALRATEILLSPEVEALFVRSDLKVRFYSVRSLSSFHKAQILLFEGDTDVIDYLQSSKNDSIQIGDEGEEDWINYVKATIAYLNNDIAGIKSLLHAIESNRSLVENFIRGLEERGYPDYIRDYSRERN